MGKKLQAVRDTKAFIEWAKQAAPGEWVVYHIGILPRDRIDNNRVNILADTVHVLARTGWVVTSQAKVNYPVVEGHQYIATRSTGGYAPKALMSGKITGFQFLLLEAVQQRPTDQAAVRAIREATSASDQAARRLLRDLEDEGLVECSVNNTILTQAGLRALH